MTVIYLTEYNTRCYGVIFHNSGCIEVRSFKDISNDENYIMYIKPLKTFLGKSENVILRVCQELLINQCLMEILFY